MTTIKTCTIAGWAIVALAATQLLIVAGQTSEQKAKNYANQKLESPLEHKRSRAGELKRIVTTGESAPQQQANKSKNDDKTGARLAKQLASKPTRARLLRSTDKLASSQQAQQQSIYQHEQSDSWNDRHSLVPTLSDQEQGDELVALASDNEPQVSEQQVKIAPQVRPAMTASVAQFMKSYGDKFVRDYDEANSGGGGGNKSRPMDEYYTDEDDEDADEAQQQQQQQQQTQRAPRYTMSAQSVAPVDQRQRAAANRTNQSGELLLVKQQQSSDAWTPKISQQQVGGRLVEQLMGSRETVGSSLTKTDMAIEYLRNILKSKQQQQVHNSSSEQAEVPSNYKAPDSFYPLPIVMSDYANKQQAANKTRTDEAKFSIDDAKQTRAPSILHYTPTYAPRPLSTDYEDDDNDKKLFTPAASTTFAAEMTSTTGRQTVAPSSSSSPPPPPPTQRPETEIASLANGTPLGGDYVEAQDDYLRGQSMTMQQQQQARMSAQLEAAASEQQAAYHHHHQQALPTLSFNPLPPRPLAQPASPPPPPPSSSRFFVMQPIQQQQQQQQISEVIKPEVKGQKAQELPREPLVNFKQEVAPPQAAPKVATQLPSFAAVQANRTEQQFKGQPQQIIQQLVQLDEEQKAVTVAQPQAAVKGVKFVQQTSRPVVQQPAMISSKLYATNDEQQQLHEQQQQQLQQHEQQHHQKQQHQEYQQQQAHYQQHPHPAPHHQANPSGAHHHEQQQQKHHLEMPPHEQQQHHHRVSPAKQHHLEYTQYTPLEVAPPVVHRRPPHTPPKIVSYNYFESGPSSESSSHEQQQQQQQPTNFQFGDSLLSSTGDVEHVLSSAELEAIQSQFMSAEHPVVPLGDSPVSHYRQQQQQYNLASLIKSQDLAQRLSSPTTQQQQQQHDEQELLKELARNHEDSVSSFVNLQQQSAAHSKTRDPMHSAASEQSAQLQSQPQQKSEMAQKPKQKSLIVYLNHPRADDMSRASSASISDDGLAQLISEQTSGDPFVSAKEFDAQGLSKETKHLDVSSLRGLGLGAQEAKELTAQQDKDGLSVVVIGDAYKYKKIVLLISSKSGGLKFIPMVKDMR